MKTIFTCFRGSIKNKKEDAFSVREYKDKTFALYQGSTPLVKDIPSFPTAINMLMHKMGIWKSI